MARPKGTANKVTQMAFQKASELGIDPFETLLLFAAEKWQELGYEARTETKYTEDGKEYEEFIIPPSLRVQSAKESIQYLLPKRKSVEFQLRDIPEDAFDQEVQRRIHLKILKGEKIG